MNTIKLTASDTAYVSKIQCRTNFCGSTVLKIGLEKAASIDRFCLTTENRALIKFGSITSLPQTSRIVSAGMHVYVKSLQERRDGCGTEVFILRNKRDFDAECVTWDTKPDTEETRSRICFMQSDIPEYVFCDITGLAIEWHEGKTPNFGITLKTDKAERDFLQALSIYSQKPPFASLQLTDCRRLIKGEDIEHVFEISKCAEENYTPAVDGASAQTLTFFIKNTSKMPVKANLQISPDCRAFIDEAQILMIPPEETNALTPYFYSKYYRIRLSGGDSAGDPLAKVWCQLQARNYYMY